MGAPGAIRSRSAARDEHVPRNPPAQRYRLCRRACRQGLVSTTYLPVMTKVDLPVMTEAEKKPPPIVVGGKENHNILGSEKIQPFCERDPAEPV